jgi:hypothetical protein
MIRNFARVQDIYFDIKLLSIDTLTTHKIDKLVINAFSRGADNLNPNPGIGFTKSWMAHYKRSGEVNK